MTGHDRHHGNSSHRHDNHNGKRRAEEQRRDREIREELIKELKERRSRKERRRMARDVVEGNMGTPWWFEIIASQNTIQNWMVAEVQYKELCNSDEVNKAQELKKIARFVYDRERRRFALAEVEKKWNANKAERDRLNTQKAWEGEFNRWMEELEAADSYDSRYAGPDEDGVTWSPQSLVTINDEISKRHLSRCMPSLRKPASRGAHCKDCEDENEVGHFWGEYNMANKLQKNSGSSKSLDPNIDMGPLLGSLRSWNDIEKQISADNQREEANKSPAQKAKEKNEREAQASRHARRMQNRAAIEKERRTPWDTERKATDRATESLFNFIKARHQQAQHSNEWGSKIASKLHSKATQERIEAEAKQQVLVLERNFEMARKAEEERWLQELGENRNARNAKIHLSRCMTSQSLLERGGSCCEDCKYDSRLSYLAEEKEQRRLRVAYDGN
ncbi:uncharacterized protein Bfra_009685 [Botrytis fragariae]|uniref:Uncharacterized protein n=1 Tax=Botrytis fragariae TaxID=1964551 RepID=A0A8H6EFI6_9HELO|nr:uncharacterized protein Bfra_009685 [Botrytis fragariae]KAF5870301.1 hypothetical protein Bfra_009685 [Botrytis fragariae]